MSSMVGPSPGSLGSTLQEYQAQLQANQTALGQQLPLQRSPLPPTHQSIPPASSQPQQQHQPMSRAIEKHGEVQLDKSRVTLLLEINTELLREVLLVQPNFKNTEEAKNDPTFRECMRRLQLNLAYLAAIADRSHKKPASMIPACPGVLLPPPNLPALEVLYKKLQGLYPGINPANPPQHQQTTQLGGPTRSGSGASPEIQGTQSMPPPLHLTSPTSNHMSSPPPQIQSHQSSPPPMMMQQPPPPPPSAQPLPLQMPLTLPHQQPHPQQHQPPLIPQPIIQPQQEPPPQLIYQSHPHSPLQDNRENIRRAQFQAQLQAGHSQQQQQVQQYAHLQQQAQQQHRQVMLQRAAAQQQQIQQHHQQQGSLAGQMGNPASMGMGVSVGPGLNPMQASMAPQNAIQATLLAGGMSGLNYGSMNTHIPNSNQMGPAMGGPMVSPVGMGNMTQMGQMNMSGIGMGMGMGGGMGAGMASGGGGGGGMGTGGGVGGGGGFPDLNAGMWNSGWQGP